MIINDNNLPSAWLTEKRVLVLATHWFYSDAAWVCIGTESLLAAAETPGKKEIIILIKFNSRVLAYARHCHCCNQQHCCEQLQRECSEGECHSWPWHVHLIQHKIMKWTQIEFPKKILRFASSCMRETPEWFSWDAASFFVLAWGPSITSKHEMSATAIVFTNLRLVRSVSRSLRLLWPVDATDFLEKEPFRSTTETPYNRTKIQYQ